MKPAADSRLIPDFVLYLSLKIRNRATGKKEISSIIMSYSRRQFILKTGLLSGVTGLNIATSDKLNTLIEPGVDRLVLLGTQGGPFIRSYKQTPSASLIIYKNMPIVIDAGFGVTFKLLDAGINLASLKYIFITHHHSDHNLELGPLLYNAWINGLKEPVHVYAPAGLSSLLAYYWKSNQFDIETRIKDEVRPDIRELVITHEFSEGDMLSTTDMEVSALRNSHPPITESYALRFKLNKKIVIFSGDTGYWPALAGFASKADYLVHEVMYPPAVEEMVKRRPNAARLKESILSHHTSAGNVGRIANMAAVKTLVLNHFVPADDRSLTEQVWINAVKPTFRGRIIVGKDLLQLAL